MPEFIAADVARLLSISKPTVSRWVSKRYLVATSVDSQGRDTYSLTAILVAQASVEAAAVQASGFHVPRKPTRRSRHLRRSALP